MKDVNKLFSIAESVYEKLLLLLNNASSDHMQEPITKLSEKIWHCYAENKLVIKIEKR